MTADSVVGKFLFRVTGLQSATTQDLFLQVRGMGAERDWEDANLSILKQPAELPQNHLYRALWLGQ